MDVLLSQHPFRSPGHPEAHIPILPASGLTSEIPTKYVQCSISGRDPTLIALFVTGILGRIARGHHTSIVGFDIDTLFQQFYQYSLFIPSKIYHELF